MKNFNKLLSICSLCFAFVTFAAAQNTDTPQGLKVTKIDFSLGYETDYVIGMDYNFFINQLPAAQQARVQELNFQPSDLVSGICENPSINVGLTLEHDKYKNVEWRNALSYKPNRVDAMTYYNNSRYNGEYINLNATHAEFNLESALVYRLSIYDRLNFYGGVGTNIGMTSPNEMCIFTSLDLTTTDISYGNAGEINDQVPSGVYGSGDGYSACFDTGTQLNQRAFLQFGTALVFFQRVEIGMDLKYGIGYRADFGASIDRTNIVATNLNIRYHLHKKGEVHLPKIPVYIEF